MGGLWDVWFDDDAAVVTATYKSFKFIVIGCYNFSFRCVYVGIVRYSLAPVLLGCNNSPPFSLVYITKGTPLLNSAWVMMMRHSEIPVNFILYLP